MNVIGRTISHIEEPGDDTVLIHLHGGGALRIQGSSYEEVSQFVDYLSPEEIRVKQHEAQGQREAARLRRLKREAWNALPQEERDARRAAQRAKMSPFERAFDDVMAPMVREMCKDFNRVAYGDIL